MEQKGASRLVEGRALEGVVEEDINRNETLDKGGGKMTKEGAEGRRWACRYRTGCRGGRRVCRGG